MREHFALVSGGDLDGGGADFDGNFGVLVREFESAGEDLEVLVEGQRCSGQFLLLGVDELVEPVRAVDEDDLAVAFERRYYAVVKLGVFAHPAVAVVDVSCVDVLVGYLGEDVEPFLEEFGTESVVRTGVSEVEHQLEWRVTEWFQGQDHVVN